MRKIVPRERSQLICHGLMGDINDRLKGSITSTAHWLCRGAELIETCSQGKKLDAEACCIKNRFCKLEKHNLAKQVCICTTQKYIK